jgi:RNase H-fold protein (predicted Holliday junction resolvase)
MQSKSNINRRKKTILAIDWGSKYIWLAYCQEDQDVIFPVGYMLNDQMTHFHISDLIERYNIKTILLWRPTKQKDIQEKISQFMKWLNYIIEWKEIKIELVDEDYSSVQSGEVVSNFRKNASTDTISAMIILERWKKLSSESQITID